MERPFDYDSYSYSETDCDLLRRTNKYKDNYKDIYENTTNFYKGKNEVCNFEFFFFLMNMRHNSHTEENAIQTKFMNIYIYIYIETEREREREREKCYVHNIFTTNLKWLVGCYC